MKRKELNEGVHCVEYALMHIPDEYKELLERQYNYMEDFKNGFISYMWRYISKQRKENEEFDKAMAEVRYLNTKEGRIIKKDERSNRLSKAYTTIGNFVKETKLLDSGSRRKEYYSTVKNVYYAWIPDDSRSYAIDDVLSAFEVFFFDRGKAVFQKKYGHTKILQFKPAYSRMKSTGEINTIVQTSSRVVFENGNPYFEMWDLRDLKDIPEEECQKGKRHSKIRFRMYCNDKDELQSYIKTNPYIGGTKLLRYWKKGKWRYRVQLNFEALSPAVKQMSNEEHIMGIDLGTETIAWVRDDGEQAIWELSPDTPRVTEEIKEIDVYLDNSRRAMNPELFREDGTRISNREARELGLEEKHSKRYIKAAARRKECFRYLGEKRKLNNRILAKKLFELGNEFHIENNKVSSWMLKRCHMALKTAMKYASGARASDYGKVVADRAPGMIDARLSQLAGQKGLSYHKIEKIEGFKCTEYNHFTDKNDLFQYLNDRIVVLDVDSVNDVYKEFITDFGDTITDLKIDGKDIILQRDLYAAAKLVYCTPYKETIVNSKGKKVEVTRYKFDREGFSKFFVEKFYPKHLEYIMKLRAELANGKKISGTVFGNI